MVEGVVDLVPFLCIQTHNETTWMISAKAFVKKELVGQQVFWKFGIKIKFKEKKKSLLLSPSSPPRGFFFFSFFSLNFVM